MATNVTYEFRDNEKMFSPLAPDTATKGVEAQIQTAPTESSNHDFGAVAPAGQSQKPAIDMSRVNLVSMTMNDPTNIQNMPAPQPKATSDIGQACTEIGKVASEATEAFGKLFSLGGQDNKMEDPALKVAAPQPQPMRPGLFGM